MFEHSLSNNVLLLNQMTDHQGSIASCDSTFSTIDSNADIWDNQMHRKTDTLKIPYRSNYIDPERVDEEEYYKPRRVSSLKTNRTPPGTPKSKAVRFADAFGLDLEDVRHVFNLDQPPNIPASAVRDLNLESYSDSNSTSSQDNLMMRYEASFSQPGAAPDFLRHIRMTNVGLENAFIENNILSGTIRVMNITFNKKVTVRVSFNNWNSFVDCNANYVFDSHDGVTDRFSFSLLIPPNISCINTSKCNNQSIQFAVSFECSNGSIFWDNNGGQNYCFMPIQFSANTYDCNLHNQ